MIAVVFSRTIDLELEVSIVGYHTKTKYRKFATRTEYVYQSILKVNNINFRGFETFAKII